MNVQNSNSCKMYVYSILYSCSGNAEAMHSCRGDVVAINMNLQLTIKNKSTNENVLQLFFPSRLSIKKNTFLINLKCYMKS